VGPPFGETSAPFGAGSTGRSSHARTSQREAFSSSIDQRTSPVQLLTCAGRPARTPLASVSYRHPQHRYHHATHKFPRLHPKPPAMLFLHHRLRRDCACRVMLMSSPTGRRKAVSRWLASLARRKVRWPLSISRCSMPHSIAESTGPIWSARTASAVHLRRLPPPLRGDRARKAASAECRRL